MNKRRLLINQNQAYALMMVLMFFSFTIQKSEADTNSNVVIVENTGSTNSGGWRMIIETSGHITTSPFGKQAIKYKSLTYDVSPELVRQLLQDLDSIMPLSKLPSFSCAKSTSFGSSTFITYRDEISPDIDCTFQSAKLNEDIYKIKAVPSTNL